MLWTYQYMVLATILLYTDDQHSVGNIAGTTPATSRSQELATEAPYQDLSKSKSINIYIGCRSAIFGSPSHRTLEAMVTQWPICSSAGPEVECLISH